MGLLTRIGARGSVARRPVAAAALALATLVLASPSVAADGGSPTVPPGERVVTTTSQAGGAILVTTAEVGTLSISDCRTGYTCVWSSPFYAGTLMQYRLPGQYIPLPSFSIGSYANRYEKRATFYETVGGGGHSTCAVPGASNPAVSGWLSAARSVYQSTTTTIC
ncbi:MAG TPA: peptidase inhibitor family I36 protein [Cellulomonas sp.]|uniref:peptidase inhibitor family I36 protein n=1 Tax=Cellulomonas sp. TaxID=40001 RepID=UPI002E328120|nr:peptidase inhibitor family I36 protein [Cellulomonas sp.]HEX5331312.1 peptidase inhibitor family I36 protein [Cellulomonas sp.]